MGWVGGSDHAHCHRAALPFSATGKQDTSWKCTRWKEMSATADTLWFWGPFTFGVSQGSQKDKGNSSAFFINGEAKGLLLPKTANHQKLCLKLRSPVTLSTSMAPKCNRRGKRKEKEFCRLDSNWWFREIGGKERDYSKFLQLTEREVSIPLERAKDRYRHNQNHMESNHTH